VAFDGKTYDKDYITYCLPYAQYFAKINKPDIDRLAMLAAFEVHDAIYGSGVSRDRAHESGSSYHEWLKGIIKRAIINEVA